MLQTPDRSALAFSAGYFGLSRAVETCTGGRTRQLERLEARRERPWRWPAIMPATGRSGPPRRRGLPHESQDATGGSASRHLLAGDGGPHVSDRARACGLIDTEQEPLHRVRQVVPQMDQLGMGRSANTRGGRRLPLRFAREPRLVQHAQRPYRPGVPRHGQLLYQTGKMS